MLAGIILNQTMCADTVWLHLIATLSRHQFQDVANSRKKLETRLSKIEANLGRLRFVQLGSILAPIKRAKSGSSSELSVVE